MNSQLLRYNNLSLYASPSIAKLISDYPKLRHFLFRKRLDQPIMVFDELYSNDPSFRACSREIAQMIESYRLKGKNLVAMSNDALRLYSVAGMLQYPIPSQPQDNSELRISLDLPLTWLDDSHQLIFDELFNLMFSQVAPGNAHLNNRSSTTIPDFSREWNVKMDWLVRSIEKLQILKTDFTAADLIQHGLYPLFALVTRTQPDLPSKVRKVHSNGQFVVTQSQIAEPDKAMRVRAAYGMSGSVSYLSTLLQALIRNSYYQRYEFTYKHRTVNQVCAKLRGRYSRSLDVTQFDQTVPEFLLERFVTNFSKLYPKLGRLLRYQLGGIALHPYPFGPFQDKWVIDFDINDEKSYALTKGLPSGVPINPDLGKFTFTFALLCAMHDVGMRVIGNVDSYLKGKEEFAILNMSDDTILAHPNEQTVVKVLQAIRYFKIDEEPFLTFLGNIYQHKGLLYHGYPNVTSFFVRHFVPEYGVNGHNIQGRRQWPGIGWEFKKQYYMANPDFSTLYNKADKIFRSHIGRSMDSMMSRFPKTLPINLNPSSIDMDVYLDPDKLYYKYEAADISPELLNNFTRTIPDQLCHTLINAVDTIPSIKPIGEI